MAATSSSLSTRHALHHLLRRLPTQPPLLSSFLKPTFTATAKTTVSNLQRTKLLKISINTAALFSSFSQAPMALKSSSLLLEEEEKNDGFDEIEDDESVIENRGDELEVKNNVFCKVGLKRDGENVDIESAFDEIEDGFEEEDNDEGIFDNEGNDLEVKNSVFSEVGLKRNGETVDVESAFDEIENGFEEEGDEGQDVGGGDEKGSIEVGLKGNGVKVPTLTVKEKKELASYAHGLGKKLKSQLVGKSGVTDNVVASFIETLEANELLKIKIHRTCPGELEDVVQHLEEATGSVVVGQIGRTVIIYRPCLTKLKAEQKKKQDHRVFVRKEPNLKTASLRRLSGHGRRGSSRVQTASFS